MTRAHRSAGWHASRRGLEVAHPHEVVRGRGETGTANSRERRLDEGARLVVEHEHSHLPRLFTAAEKDRLLGGPHRAFFGPQLSTTRTYELIPLIYKPGSIAEVSANYLLIGSGTFARFFDTPAPPADNPLYQDYINRRDTYVQILEGSTDNGWKLQQTFDTGKGPQLRLYRRTG